MKKVYIVLIENAGILKVVAEFDEIKKCNKYLEDKRYRVIDAWKAKN